MSSSGLLSPVLEICSCLLFSGAATVFYKKSFDARGVPVVASLFTLALLLQNADTFLTFFYIAMTLSYLLYTSASNAEWLRTTANLDVFLPFLAVVLDVKFDILGMIGIETAYSQNLKICVAAIPQFIRKPNWLKAKLQGVRSRLGPIYVFYVTSYVTSITKSDGILQWTPMLAGAVLLGCGVTAVVYNTDNSTLHDRNTCGTVIIFAFAAIASILDPEESATWASPTLTQLSVMTVGKFAMFASILAGVVLFRPDNSTMLDLIGKGLKGMLDCLPHDLRPNIQPYRTSLAERRYYHGRLMICSLVCCVCLTVTEYLCGK
ncbi:hypothetical protein ACF0H5_014575 [Mactra antiquata]